MTIVVDDLPNDVDALKQFIVEQHQRHQAEIDQAVKDAVAAILRRYYGPKSEKFDPRQLLLFGQQVEGAKLETLRRLLACLSIADSNPRSCD